MLHELVCSRLTLPSCCCFDEKNWDYVGHANHVRSHFQPASNSLIQKFRSVGFWSCPSSVRQWTTPRTFTLMFFACGGNLALQEWIVYVMLVMFLRVQGLSGYECKLPQCLCRIIQRKVDIVTFKYYARCHVVTRW